MGRKTLMEEVYEKRINEVNEMDPTDENYVKAVDCACKLADRVIEEKRDKKDRIIKIVKDGAEIALKAASVAGTVGLAILCLRFEEKGTVTTSVGRKTFDRIFKGL